MGCKAIIEKIFTTSSHIALQKLRGYYSEIDNTINEILGEELREQIIPDSMITLAGELYGAITNVLYDEMLYAPRCLAQPTRERGRTRYYTEDDLQEIFSEPQVIDLCQSICYVSHDNHYLRNLIQQCLPGIVNLNEISILITKKNIYRQSDTRFNNNRLIGLIVTLTVLFNNLNNVPDLSRTEIESVIYAIKTASHQLANASCQSSDARVLKLVELRGQLLSLIDHSCLTDKERQVIRQVPHHQVARSLTSTQSSNFNKPSAKPSANHVSSSVKTKAMRKNSAGTISSLTDKIMKKLKQPSFIVTCLCSILFTLLLCAMVYHQSLIGLLIVCMATVSSSILFAEVSRLLRSYLFACHFRDSVLGTRFSFYDFMHSRSLYPKDFSYKIRYPFYELKHVPKHIQFQTQSIIQSLITLPLRIRDSVLSTRFSFYDFMHSRARSIRFFSYKIRHTFYYELKHGLRHFQFQTQSIIQSLITLPLRIIEQTGMDVCLIMLNVWACYLMLAELIDTILRMMILDTNYVSRLSQSDYSITFHQIIRNMYFSLTLIINICVNMMIRLAEIVSRPVIQSTGLQVITDHALTDPGLLKCTLPPSRLDEMQKSTTHLSFCPNEVCRLGNSSSQ